MRHLTLLVMLIISSFISLNAQYLIYGYVTDEDGVPYAGVRVALDGTDKDTITDAEGFYLLEDVAPGDYALTIFHSYGPVYRAVYVDENQDVEFDVQIRRRIEFDEVIVSGTRLTGEEPFNKEDIDEEYIEKHNTGQDVPYLFKKLRSTVVNSDAGNGIGYTGIRVRGLDPGHVNVTINGIPLNDSESQLVFWVDLPDVLSSTNSIQLQRGLGSSGFGAGNFGASINLNTNKTHIDPYIHSNMGIGSFNTYRGNVELGTGLMNGRFSIDGRFSYTKSDGYIDRARADLRSFYVSAAMLGLNSSLRLNVINGHEVTYQAWNGVPFSYVDDEDLRTFNSAGMDRPGSPYDDEVDNYSQTHFQLFYNKLTEVGEWTLTGFYTRGNGFFENYKGGETLSDYNFFPIDSLSGDTIREDDIIRRKWLDNHFYGANVNFQTGGEKYELKLGAHVSRFQGGHYGTIIETDQLKRFRFPFEYYRNDAVKHGASVFAKLQYEVIENLFAYGDLQYRLVDYSYGDGTDEDGVMRKGEVQYHFVNPKFGLTYRINEAWRAFGSVAMGNREPNRDDFVESGPNSEPKSEKLIDYEAGVEADFDRIKLGIYGYFMDYTDQLVLTGRINDVGEYARVNVQDSYRAGVEADIEINLAKGLFFNANTTISRNKIESFTEFVDDWDTGSQIERQFNDTDISFSPELIAFAGLTYAWDGLSWLSQKDGLELSYDHKYVGEQFLDNTMNENAKLDAFHYGDAEIAFTTSYKWLKDARLSFKVMNVLDHLYESNGWIYRFATNATNPIEGDPYGRAEGDNIYNQTGLYPQSGRHFMTTLSLKF